jgi:phosphatidylserine/phosphatidylglycerophosphate/cardiolipin synthase-like enzyme
MKSLLTIVSLFFISIAVAQEFDLGETLHYKNLIQFNSAKTHTLVFNEKYRSAITTYLNHPDLRVRTNRFIADMAPIVRSPNILNVMTYLNFKWDEENSKTMMGELISLYYLEKYLAIVEAKDDPRYNDLFSIPGKSKINVALKLKEWLKILGPMPSYRTKVEKARSCVVSLKSTIENRSGLIRKCLTGNFPAVPGINSYLSVSFAAVDIGAEIPLHPGSVISRTGFIPGNKVTTLNKNLTNWDDDYRTALEDTYVRIVKKYEDRWGKKTDQQMIEEMLVILKTSTRPFEDIFNEGQDDPALNVDTNVVWQSGGQTEIDDNRTFPAILRAIRSAESTIFVDLFFWGGTMGISLTKEIIKQLEAKPGLKLVFLHDNINHYGHRAEMGPVFNLLRAYMILHPDKALVLPSYVLKNVTGFPDFVDELVSDSNLSKYGLDEKFSLYLKAKSDHSKVIVIDGDRPDRHPVAFVGSKNMTDISGAVCNDEVIRVEGPAASVLLDNYWNDLYEGLKLDWRLSDFMGAYYEKISTNGWAKDFGTGGDRIKRIKGMLAPVDLLKRYETADDGEAGSLVPNLKVRVFGEDKVRIGENTVKSLITSVLTQNLMVILSAKKQILIKEQLLYDTRLIRALIKKKSEGVDVKVILEGFDYPGSAYPGMPNLLYLNHMKKNGIEVRWKLNGDSKYLPPEYHGKTISVDGVSSEGEIIASSAHALVVGSANKDYMTMKGAFRETQLEVFNREAQRVHDEAFWKDWNDQEKGSEEASTAGFERSDFAKKLVERGITVEIFLSNVRRFLETLYTLKSIDR